MKQLFIFALLIPLSAAAVEDEELAMISSPANSTLEKVATEDRTSVVEEINNSASWRESPVRVQSCDDMYYMRVGVPDGNISWAGICTTTASKNKTFVCADQMLGRFELIPDYKLNPEWIALAIYDNCWGG